MCAVFKRTKKRRKITLVPPVISKLLTSLTVSFIHKKNFFTWLTFKKTNIKFTHLINKCKESFGLLTERL